MSDGLLMVLIYQSTVLQVKNVTYQNNMRVIEEVLEHCFVFLQLHI